MAVASWGWTACSLVGRQLSCPAQPASPGGDNTARNLEMSILVALVALAWILSLLWWALCWSLLQAVAEKPAPLTGRHGSKDNHSQPDLYSCGLLHGATFPDSCMEPCWMGKDSTRSHSGYWTIVQEPITHWKHWLLLFRVMMFQLIVQFSAANRAMSLRTNCIFIYISCFSW